MRTGHSLVLIAAAVWLVACGGGVTANPQPTQIQPPSGMSLEEQAQFVQTAAAIQQQAQATYQSGMMQATGVAAEATNQAQAIATATAAQIEAEQRAMAGASTATAESLAVTQTAAVMSGQATATAIANNGTATAVANLGELDKQEIVALATSRSYENDERGSKAEAARNWASFTRYLPWLAVAFLLLVGVAAFSLYRRRNQPWVVTANGRQEVFAPPHLAQARISKPEQLALPSPSTTAAPSPLLANQPIELPPMTRGHVLVAGETGSGKSTAIGAILRRRQNVVVLDPHAAPGDWGTARVIGGGRDFDAIAGFVAQMRGLLGDRYRERSRGTTQFDPITVATDEMPAIVAAVGQEIGEVWRQWVREGRKVGLFLVISTQSTRVKTLGIEGEGDLLENFDVLLLGKVAAEKCPNLVAGMERPAVLRTLNNARPVIIPIPPPAVSSPTVRETGPFWSAPLPDEMSYQELLEEANQAEQDAEVLAQRGPVGSRRAAAILLTGLDNGYAYERGDAALAMLAQRGAGWAAGLIGSTTTASAAA